MPAWSSPNSASVVRRDAVFAGRDREQQVLGLDGRGTPADGLVDRAHHDALQGHAELLVVQCGQPCRLLSSMPAASSRRWCFLWTACA